MNNSLFKLAIKALYYSWGKQWGESNNLQLLK